jgi:hypothetical protein
VFPKHWSFTRIAIHFFCEALTNQKIIRVQQEKIMAALDDLQSAVAGTQELLGTLQTDITEFISQNSGGATDAQLEAVTASVGTINTSLQTIITSLAPPAPQAQAKK